MTLREVDSSVEENTARPERDPLAYARRACGAVAVQNLTPAALADWPATSRLDTATPSA